MLYEGAPTLGQVDSEFSRGDVEQTDLVSAYVLHRLLSLGPVFQSGTVRATVGRTEVQCIQTGEKQRDLVSKRIILS